MAEVYVGNKSEFKEKSRKIVSVGQRDIGVFLHNGRFVAYGNHCLHQAGPVCEGEIIGKVEHILDDDKRIIEERFSESVFHIVCPWHGWEYDLSTGVCAGDKRLKLKSYPVIERGEEVYLVVDEA